MHEDPCGIFFFFFLGRGGRVNEVQVSCPFFVCFQSLCCLFLPSINNQYVLLGRMMGRRGRGE